ncbi:hypothetical protein TFLX_00580 [Thermoflexales bacterium]|nr:hypothetical protein TFLX_00580 [Thermoflexales bacterium]
MIHHIVSSPVTPLAVGLALTWFDIVTSEPFDRLTYALNYAEGHVAHSLWTQAQAAEFVQQAWPSALPELLGRVMVYVSITGVLLYIQRYWHRRRVHTNVR